MAFTRALRERIAIKPPLQEGKMGSERLKQRMPMASIPAVVKPELLAWARTTAGYSPSQAAEKLKIPTDRLVAWESGQENLSVPQLRKMAMLYKRPLAAFFLPAPPVEPEFEIHDFRLSPETRLSRSPELLQAIRNAHSRREIAIELYEQINDEPPPDFSFKFSVSDDPEQSAAQLKQFLRVSLPEQKSWPEAESFARWRAAIERANVLVFQASRISTEVMRAFSVARQPYPVMVLNSSDAQKARIFSMLHELTHIALGKEGVCDFHESKDPNLDVEVFCNRIAGEMLVPRSALIGEPELKGAVDAEDVESLASRYRVSREVVLRRLLICGKIKQSFYDRMFSVYRQQYESIKEAQKAKEGGPKYSVRAFNAAGPLFARLVLQNYREDKITASDVADYLSVKMGYLPEIEKLAWR
ncbi:MAG: XRE family transcriptional regulator [Candidatus Obscuribacterales bacterium]